MGSRPLFDAIVNFAAVKSVRARRSTASLSYPQLAASRFKLFSRVRFATGECNKRQECLGATSSLDMHVLNLFKVSPVYCVTRAELLDLSNIRLSHYSSANFKRSGVIESRPDIVTLEAYVGNFLLKCSLRHFCFAFC